MPVDLNILNARVFTDDRLVDGGISVDGGRILRVGKEANLPKSEKKLDVGGLVVIPGLIDVHVHLRDMQLSYKEDFYSGTAAAAAGGFTTVLDMPNTQPITDSPLLLKEKIQEAESKIVINVGFYASFPAKVKDFRPMAKLGMAGFKANLLTAWSKLNLEDDDSLKVAIAEASSLGKPVAFHVEDGLEVRSRVSKLKETSRNSPSDFFSAHTEGSEVRAARRVLGLLNCFKEPCRVHFCHVTLAKTVKLLGRAKRKHCVTCEASPHHLFLSQESVKGLGGVAITCPPIRRPRRPLELWRMVREGDVDMIASDHAPHKLEEKRRVNVWNVPPGSPGLETTLPLMLTKVANREIGLKDVVNLLSHKPAKAFGLNSKGDVAPGKDADLVVVDLKKRHKIDASAFHSKAKYSLFQGWHVTGRVVKTLVGGVLVADEGQVTAKPGCGCVLRVN